MSEESFYARLSAKFDQHQQVNGFTTITAEQVVTRLNEVLGYEGWSFFVKEHGIHEESDSTWALGRLEVYRGDGAVIVREQFGSQKFNRYSQGPNQGKIIDLANDQMGAATGALKKCASLIGVGLYLRSKGGSNGQARGQQGNQSRQGASAERSAPSNSSRPPTASTGAPMLCSDCGAPLEPFRVRYKPSEQYPDGREVTWSVQQLAQESKKKYGIIRCGEHFFTPSP